MRINLTEVLYVDVYGQVPDAPAICIFHGGGWVDGSPAMLKGLATAISERGVTVLAPSYRTLNAHGVTVREAIDDAVQTCRWLEKWSERPSTLFLGGASAGGLLALHGFSRIPGIFSGMVLLNPVTDTSKGGFTNRQIPVGGNASVSPQRFVNSLPKVPTLIIHSARDETVPIGQSEKFLAGWCNEKARLVRWGDGPHGFFNLPANTQAVAAEIADFLMACDARPTARLPT
jgi:acetyl esterase/lipase